MKRTLLMGLLLLGTGWAHAGIYSQTFSPGTTVEQGNAVPSVFTGTFNNPLVTGPVSGLTVQLNITGGFSGAFTIYLVGPNGGTPVYLLEQPGSFTSGANITLQDGAGAINSGSNLSSGTYAPSDSLSGLNGQSANGNWTLTFANLGEGEGGSVATLNSWTLNITAVPEPVNVALGVFAGVFALAGGRQWWLKHHKARATVQS